MREILRPIYFYRITMQIRGKNRLMVGIKDSMSADIANVSLTFKRDAEKASDDKLESFECVQVPQTDPRVKEYIRKNNIKIMVHEKIDDQPEVGLYNTEGIDKIPEGKDEPPGKTRKQLHGEYMQLRAEEKYKEMLDKEKKSQS